MDGGAIRYTSVYLYLTNGPNKLECLVAAMPFQTGVM